MSISEYIKVYPFANDAICLAYSRGLISYETLFKLLSKLKENEK